MKQCKASQCNNPVFSHGYCRWHQYLRTDKAIQKQIQKHRQTFNKKTGIPPRTYKTSIYKDKNAFKMDFGFSSQRVLFNAIWERRAHYSFISGKWLGGVAPEYWINCFAHVLAKGKYPLWKLNPENIVLLTPHEHALYDQGTQEERELYQQHYPVCNWQKLFDYREELLEKYKLYTK